MIKIDKTVVFSDFHGDVDIMAKSFAAKGLMNYDGNAANLIDSINAHANKKRVPLLEEWMIKQKKPVRLLFLGDCLDRYNYGYHILQFLSKIRWKRFNIHPVFLLGNHDLLNVMVLVNPYKIHRIYQGNGPSYSKTAEYLRSMGVDKSLESFVTLHGDELIKLQKKFFKDGRIEFPQGHYTITLTYDRDYSFFNKIRFAHPKKEWEYLNDLMDAMGLEDMKRKTEYSYSRYDDSLGDDTLYLLWEFHNKEGKKHRNWWQITPTDIDRKEADGSLYLGAMRHANVIRRKINPRRVEILPIDWRVMSLVWRKHYGDYFRKTKLVVHEDHTLYAHGGISPLSLMDSQVFGAFYFPFEGGFFEVDRWMTFDMLVGRINRVATQVLTNALNDCGFDDMCGAEVIDQMGYWRGCHKGFPQFGGPLWCDFEFMKIKLDRWHEEDRQQMLGLYKKFCDAYDIKRIICGHTPFHSYREVGPLLKMLKPFKEEIGLEYICIDNGCSRAYRSENPVVNGIEIDNRGKITPDPEEGLKD